MVVVRRVPGVGAGLVEVAVQGAGGVGVGGEGDVCVGGGQSAAQRGGDRRLVGAVPERRRETPLTHGEGAV